MLGVPSRKRRSIWVGELAVRVYVAVKADGAGGVAALAGEVFPASLLLSADALATVANASNTDNPILLNKVFIVFPIG